MTATDLVGENIELRRNREPEGVGGLAIDHHIEPGWLLDWPRAHSKLIGRYGALLPLFRLVGVPCIAAFRRVKSLLCHHSDRPKLANRSAAYFAGATSLTGVSSALVSSSSLFAAVKRRSIRPARRSCTTRVAAAFLRSSKIL